MNLQENGGLEHSRHPGFDAENTEASIRELEQQYEGGEISSDRYLEKKAALVSIYLKSTTRSTRRRKRSYESDDY